MLVILRISKLYKRIFSFTKSGLINEIKVLADAELVLSRSEYTTSDTVTPAYLLINQGCDALMLADRLGHEKVSTTLNTYSHLFPHKQQELVHSLESLQATDSPTPEPPSDNPLLEAAGITCEVPQTQDNGSDVTIRPQFGPALVPPNTASGKIIQMPQRKII